MTTTPTDNQTTEERGLKANELIANATTTGNPYNCESIDWSTPHNFEVFNNIRNAARREIALRVIREGVDLSTLDSTMRKEVEGILKE